MPEMTLTAARLVFKRRYPLAIAKWTKTVNVNVLLTLRDENGIRGRGEATGDYTIGETDASLISSLTDLAAPVRDGVPVPDLIGRMGRGGARNALDSAWRDYQAKRGGMPAAAAAGTDEPRPVESTFTIGLGPLEWVMAQAALTDHRILKLKCDARHHIEVVRAVRSVRPDAAITVDANEAWSLERLCELAPVLADLGVVLIEQPLKADTDHLLEAYDGPVPLAADESFRDRDDLERVARHYHYANIKLDKCGGLTEGIACAAALRNAGVKPMVGCMGGSSLANAPAFLLAHYCDFVDLDSSIALIEPWEERIRFEKGWAQPFSARLWG